MAYIPQTPAVAKSIADKYAATAEYLQKRHDATVAAASELKANIAALPLNEAEGEWRNNIVNAIDEKLNNIDIGGFVGYGFNDIVKATGDIASSPAMIGRLQAQKDYTDFQNEIKSRQDLTELEKEYFLTKNPYYYQDKVNDKGQIVNGTKWQPTERALTKVDFTKVLDKAKDWAAADSNSGSIVHFVDKNGEETTDLSRIKDAYYFNTITSENVYLSKDKIRQAIKSAVANTPGAAESLAQDYKIAVWAAENKGINDGVIGEDGLPISSEEYFALRTDSFVDHTSYNHTKYSNKIEETELAKQRARALAEGIDNNLDDNNALISPRQAFASASVLLERGDYIKENTKVIKDMELRAQSAKNNIDNILGSYVKINYNATETDLKNQILDLFNKGIINEDNYEEIMSNLNDIVDANYAKDYIFENASEEDKERYNFINLYNAGLPINESAGSVGERYNKLLKKVWTDNNGEIASYIGYELNNKLYNNFIHRIGGENKFKELGGIIEINNNGNKIIKLPYNYKENTGIVLSTLKVSIDATNHIAAVPLLNFNDKGSMVKTNSNIDERLIRLLTKQQRKVDEYLNEHPVYDASTELAFSGIEEMKRINDAKNDPKNAAHHLKLAEEERDRTISTIIGLNPSNYDSKIYDDKEKKFIDVTEVKNGLTDMNNLWNLLKQEENLPKDNKTHSVGVKMYQSTSSNLFREVTISAKGKDNLYRYLIPLGENSRDAIKFKNDDTTMARNRLSRTFKYNIPVRLEGLDNANIIQSSINNNTNEPTYSVIYNNNTIDMLSEDDALNIIQASISLEKLFNYGKAGLPIDAKQYSIIAKYVSSIYATYGLVNAKGFYDELLEAVGLNKEEK